jgi:hypothetical protein
MDFVKDILHIASFGVYEGNNPNKESTVPSRPEPREMSDSRDDDFEKAIRHKKQLERDADARRIAKHNAKIYKRDARQQARNKFFAQFFPFLYTTYYPPETFGERYEERRRYRCYICGTVPSGGWNSDGSGDPDHWYEIDFIRCASCQRYICKDHSRSSYCPSCVADITRRYG